MVAYASVSGELVAAYAQLRVSASLQNDVSLLISETSVEPGKAGVCLYLDVYNIYVYVNVCICLHPCVRACI